MRALVFSGGGSRGAYECGAWQALNELDVQFDAVYGTSIGAINAALVAQGDLDRAVELWSSVTLQQIADIPEGELSIDRMISRKRDLLPFIIENAKNILVDVAPFERLLRENIDEARVRASGVKFGCVVTRVRNLRGVNVRLKDIPQGRLCDYLMASASCFPVFPMKTILGERYIDGGYMDNLPVGMAVEDGADEIIAVDVHPEFTHPEYLYLPFLKQVHPLREVGGFMDFTPEKLRRMRTLGYNDTMKAYGRFDGMRYTFRPVDAAQIESAARRYVRMIALLDTAMAARDARAVLLSKLGEGRPGMQLSWKDALLRGLELAAEALNFRDEGIYEVDPLTQHMLGYVRGTKPGAPFNETGLAETARTGGSALVVYLYHAFRSDMGFCLRMAKKLAETPAETAAALYLACMTAA